MRIKKRGGRALDIHIRYVLRPAPEDATPTIVILSAPHRPFLGGTAYQAYTYLTNRAGRAWWEPAGDLCDDLATCLEAATAHVGELCGQDNRTPFDPPVSWPIRALLLLAYE
ncbi:hypothetical protein, partial [Nonomuraea antimicrobica]|uniref:hypothetical protein n=1 Tax=Nonomuraea antimicrobica TaxID=561173 RepID=UPI0031E8EE52